MGTPRPPEGRAAGRTDPLGEAARRTLSPAYEVLNRVQPIGFWPTYLARREGEDGGPVLLSLMPRKGLGTARVSQIGRGLASAAATSHPHSVPLLEHGEEEAFLWFATRRDMWRPLASIIKGGGSFAEDELIRVAREASRFLVLLHRQEIAHGALCPANFLLDRRERLRIANTGADGPILAHRVAKGLPLGIVGEYAAPEVLAGAEATARSDQYSLARVLRACAGDTSPAVVSAIVGRATADLPDQRYAHVMDFLDAYLDAWSIAGASSRAPRGQARPQGGTPSVLLPAFEPADEVDGRSSVFRNVLVLMLGAGLGAGALAGAGALFDGEERPLLSVLQEGGARVLEAATAALSGQSAEVTGDGDAGDAPAAWEDWEWEDPRDTVRSATLPSRDEPRAGTSTASRSAEPPIREATGQTAAAGPSPTRGSADATVRRPPPTRAAPAGTPLRTVPEARAPTRSEPEPPILPGLVWVNAFPWGTVYIDGQRLGNTPLVGVSVEPGSHVLRVEREGFEPFESSIRVSPGSDLYRTDIVLRKRPGS